MSADPVESPRATEGPPIHASGSTGSASSVNSTCPLQQLLDTLAGKWAFPVLYRLICIDRPARFGELHRSIERITQKELTKHLREFEALGLVRRAIYAEVPPRVEYEITDYGRTLRAPLDALVRWSVEHGEPLFVARRRLLAAAQDPAAEAPAAPIVPAS
jgi:DNA-binding HxlR family transcriptional regulator